jgi:hypothetical protein
MIVALQYHDGDLEQTMALARLLADLEPSPRNDALLALVCQPGTPRPELVARTIVHCRRRFPVEEIVSEYGATGYPEGCNALWRGTAAHFFQRFRMGRLPSSYLTDTPHAASLLTLDGGDGVPLHPDWLDQLIQLHLQTLETGKFITGTPYFLGGCPLHVNPNAVFQLDIFHHTRLLDPAPRYLEPGWTNFAFDVYHREEMIANARLSSAVRTNWRGGGQPATRELLLDLSEESLWLHGHKDEGLHWIAREHLSRRLVPPQIKHYDMGLLLLQEQARRDFERRP